MIRVRLVPNLHTYRGELNSIAKGHPVHGASDLRKREIALDSRLLTRPGDLRRILIHEIFHFAWPRLGNPARRSFTALLALEIGSRARGELGWPAEREKSRIRDLADAAASRAWRLYTCESFCDTAAWLYSGLRRHAEFTLAKRYRQQRARWFREYFERRKLSI